MKEGVAITHDEIVDRADRAKSYFSITSTKGKATDGDDIMGFVNEYIPEDDIEKYGIAELDNRFVVGGTTARDWTIDRERNMYLRQVARGREDTSHLSTWTFLWHDQLIVVYIELLATRGGRGEPCWSHQRIRKLEMPAQVDRAEMLTDLREALLAYKDGGVYSASTAYSLTLDT